VNLELLDVLVYGPGRHHFDPADHPSATHMRGVAQGGAGGHSADGAPGEPGTSEHADVTSVRPVTIEVGRGGRGSPGTGDGEDGLVVIELYRMEET
jgi:hypothetical protein